MKTIKLNRKSMRGAAVKIKKVVVTDLDGNDFEFESVAKAAEALGTSENYLRVCEGKYKRFRGAAVEFVREIEKLG